MLYTDLKFPDDALFLVTGGAGFIGSNLCEAILKLGYKVRCLDDLSTGKQANIEMFITNPNFEFINADVIHPLQLDVDEIYNLACPASPPKYLKYPIETIKASLAIEDICKLAKYYDKPTKCQLINELYDFRLLYNALLYSSLWNSLYCSKWHQNT